MNRTAWKFYYRQLRIIRRESLKASMDMLIYGTGFVHISDDGFVNHILPQSVVIK
jgi:hypothetical protein